MKKLKFKIRNWLIKKLIGEKTVTFWVKGKGETSNILNYSEIPDIYIDGKSIIKPRKYSNVTLVWGKKENNFNGYIDSLAIYSRSLKKEEIKKII